ncbi:MAG TPA: DUF2992 family protein [Oscillospiraceae bacterium]|nr:DUF2992 family protein [Oscillospiraceae bacterium]HPF56076.1 DUF2992 family protein [Clostridiales bacterium]HPK36394.1 DUF2992 family protein [Oscillospiraceae bacterium]HPR76518.1 DUF2992 family protein [Oscillospiraceae bacterium]
MERKGKSKAIREAEKERRFELKQDKRKEKHRGISLLCFLIEP